MSNAGLHEAQNCLQKFQKFWLVLITDRFLSVLFSLYFSHSFLSGLAGDVAYICAPIIMVMFESESDDDVSLGC